MRLNLPVLGRAARVVAGARAHGELARALGRDNVHLNAYGTCRPARCWSDSTPAVYWLRMSCAICVQMASVSSTFFGEEGQPAGGLRQLLQRAPRFFHRTAILVIIVVAEEADRVDQRVGTLRFLRSTFSRVCRLALSSPSVTTSSTFLSLWPFFK